MCNFGSWPKFCAQKTSEMKIELKAWLIGKRLAINEGVISI